MREKLITIWRKIQKSKSFKPVVWFMTWFIDTEFFNAVIDLVERHTNKEKLQKSCIFFETNKSRIESNLKILEDEKSRNAYINAINYRCTLKRRYLSWTSPASEKYFDSQIVAFRLDETFMDCGAYIGDTVLLLEKKWKNWRNKGASLHVCCWEPDEYNAMKLEKTLLDVGKRHNNFSGSMVKMATWKEKTELMFESGADYASKLVDMGNVYIKTATIDDIATCLWGG